MVALIGDASLAGGMAFER
ncbi:MAG: hypothetical protein ACLSGS_01105 [Adlercreutzia sp.]